MGSGKGDRNYPDTINIPTGQTDKKKPINTKGHTVSRAETLWQASGNPPDLPVWETLNLSENQLPSSPGVKWGNSMKLTGRPLSEGSL